MKYMGSKAKEAHWILPYIHGYIFTNNIKKYIEPFVGGCNMIDKVQCAERYGYDINRYLIAMFKYLQDGGELPEDVSRDTYADCRAHFYLDDGYYEDWYIGAVGFLAGFNGRFYDGCYANPGMEGDRLRDYYREASDNIKNQMKSLMDVHFGVGDYRNLSPDNSVVYCDPPYEGTKGYLAISRKFDHAEFWDTMRKWSKNNIVLISEESAPDDFKLLWEEEVMRTVRATDKKPKTEKLFIHESLVDDDSVDNF